MTAPFAAMEARINAAALATLANATAMIGGVAVGVIFSNEYAESLNFIGGSGPAIKCPSASLTGIVRDSAISVAGINYTVSEIHPDGTGITVLKLETA